MGSRGEPEHLRAAAVAMLVQSLGSQTMYEATIKGGHTGLFGVLVYVVPDISLNKRPMCSTDVGNIGTYESLSRHMSYSLNF